MPEISERACQWYRQAGGPACPEGEVAWRALRRWRSLPRGQPAPFCLDWVLAFFRAIEAGTTDECLGFCAELRRAIVCDRTARWAGAVWGFRSSRAAWRGEVACASGGCETCEADWASWDEDYLRTVLGCDAGPTGEEFPAGKDVWIIWGYRYTPTLLEALLQLRGRDLVLLLREARGLGVSDRSLRKVACEIYPRAVAFLHEAVALSGPQVPWMGEHLVIRVLMWRDQPRTKAENLRSLLRAGIRRPSDVFLDWLFEGGTRPRRAGTASWGLGAVSDWMWAGCVALGAGREIQKATLLEEVCASPEFQKVAGWLREHVVPVGAETWGSGEAERIFERAVADLRRWQGGARAAWVGAVLRTALRATPRR